jgi:4-amino-4-deoxy-L-arabinose transferase-like glycosyltransferase
MSTVAMMDKGHSAEIEPIYAAQTGIAFVLWAAWWSEGRFWRAYTIPWVFLGLGMLTKGPPHLALFYLLVIPSLLFGRRIKDLWSPQHLAGLLLMSAIFLPWTLANLQLTGKAGDTAKTWAGEAAERVQVTGINWKSWLIRPFQMLADFLPWTPLLILGWWRNRSIDSPPNPEQEQWQSSEEERWNHLIRGTRWGLLIGLAILLLLPHGTARYAQPLFPALCVLLVDQFRRLPPTLRESLSKHWARTNAVARWLIAVASVAAAIFVPERLGSNPVPAWTGALIAVAAAALPLVLATRSMVLPALVQSCLVMATAAGVGLSYAGVYMDQHGDLRQNGRTMTALFSEPDRPVIFYDTDYFRSVYYLRRPYREIDGSSELPQGPAYLVLPAKNVSRGAVKRLLRTHEITELAKPTWEEKQMVVLKVDPRPKP